MTPFTDEYLKQYKKYLKELGGTKKDWALLARLEAAETYLTNQKATSPESHMMKEAWRKAAGK